ncbi:MAG TPA: hypothetical protein VMA98_05900 [Candidatus Acidoferrales bacterium]|nr:hypothetical protein [Candidatus Acidoferrales bacterium]
MRIFIAILTRFGATKPFLEGVSKLQLPRGSASMHSIVSGDFAPAQREMLFVQAMDWGAEYILTLDDDVAPSPSAVMDLIDAIRSDAAAGIVGALTNGRDGSPAVAGNWDAASPVPQVVEAIGFGCAIVRASIARTMERPLFSAQVELDFDESRATLAGDDYRFCARVREAGYNIILLPGLRVDRINRATGIVEKPQPRRTPSIQHVQHADVAYGKPAPVFQAPAINLSARVLYLHVGVHKTGTTSIQTLLAANAPALASVGIHVPYKGRPVTYFKTPYVTQHNVAWGLSEFVQYDAKDGGLEEMAEEIARIDAPAVVVSSEDFEFLHTKPELIAKLAGTFKRLGRDVRVIIYLRAQHDYALAIYNEHSKAGHGINPARYLEEISRTGVYEPKGAVGVYTGVNRFAYLPLIRAFADAFGDEAMIVRAYQSGRHPDDILKEFLALIGAERLPFASLAKPGELNVSPSFAAVLNGIYGGVKTRLPEAPNIEQLVRERAASSDIPIFNRKFDIITEAELQMLLERFGPENLEIERLYGASIPFRAAADLPQRDISAWEAVRKQRDLLDYAIERWQIS